MLLLSQRRAQFEQNPCQSLQTTARLDMGCGAPRDLGHLREGHRELPGVISAEAPEARSDDYFGTRILAVGAASLARRDTSAMQSRIAAICSSVGDRWLHPAMMCRYLFKRPESSRAPGVGGILPTLNAASSRAFSTSSRASLTIGIMPRFVERANMAAGGEV